MRPRTHRRRGYPRRSRTAAGRWRNNRYTGEREYGPADLAYLSRRGHLHLLPALDPAGMKARAERAASA